MPEIPAKHQRRPERFLERGAGAGGEPGQIEIDVGILADGNRDDCRAGGVDLLGRQDPSRHDAEEVFLVGILTGQRAGNEACDVLPADRDRAALGDDRGGLAAQWIAAFSAASSALAGTMGVRRAGPPTPLK